MKIILRLAIGAVVLLVVAAAVALFFVDSIARRVVETAGTAAVGVPVTLDSISIRPIAGAAAIEGLAVANPPGYQEAKFLTLSRGEVEVALRSLLSDQPEVPRIELDGIFVGVEQKSGTSNLKEILDGMRKSSAPAEPTKDAAPRRFKVDSLVVRDVKVRAQLLPLPGGATEVEFTIDEVQVKDLDQDNAQGVVLDELMRRVVGAVMAAVVKELAVKAPGELVAGLGDAIDSLGLPDATMTIGGGIVDLGGGIVDSAGQALQGVGQQIDQGLKGIGNGLGDLIGGQKKD